MTKNGVAFETVRYLEETPSPRELKRLLDQAGLKPLEAIRTNEPAYREHVAGRNLTDAQLIQVMAKHPDIIQRPIVVRGNKAVLARPVDKIAELGIE